MFNREYAWWLPKGSIRALLALIVVIPTMIVLATAKEYGMMMGVAIVVLNFYFLKDVLGRTASDNVGVSTPIDPVVTAQLRWNELMAMSVLRVLTDEESEELARLAMMIPDDDAIRPVGQEPT